MEKTGDESELSISPPQASTSTEASSSLCPHLAGKKRRVIDEQMLQIPLMHGWRRATLFSNINGRVQGAVAYYTPCGRKLKRHSDIMKYLAKNGISELIYDHFSFSTKVRVGDRFDVVKNPTEQERQMEYESNVKAMHVQKKEEEKEQRKQQAEILKQQKHEERLQKLEMRVVKAQKKVEEKEQRKQQALRLKQQKQEERRQKLEMMKNMKAQRKEQEKEQRRQQALILKMQKQEERRHNLEMLKNIKAQRKAEEKQQALVQKRQEQVRRQQKLQELRALKAQRKAEEREILRERRREERRLYTERLLELRRLKQEANRELRKPKEDLCLTNHKALLEMPHLTSVLLPHGSVADLLMVIHFMENFGKALGLDGSKLPKLPMLQAGLFNQEPGVSHLQDVLIGLLSTAITDPGLPPDQTNTTVLGVHVSNVNINKDNVSEVLRIFLSAHCRVHAKLFPLAESLKTKDFQAHTPAQKTSMLAFLVNELACSNAVVTGINKVIEQMDNLRREKRDIESNLRKLRSIHAMLSGKQKSMAGGEASQPSGTSTSMLGYIRKAEDSEDNVDEESDSNEQANEEEVAKKKRTIEACEEDEDQPVSVEKVQQQIQNLREKHSQIQFRLFQLSQALRSTALGHDRYRRRYWVLPQCGGVFVEGTESEEGSEDVLENMEAMGNTKLVAAHCSFEILTKGIKTMNELCKGYMTQKEVMVWDEMDRRVKAKGQQVLSTSGNSFKTVGKPFQVTTS